MNIRQLIPRTVIWTLIVTLALTTVMAALPSSAQAESTEAVCKKDHIVKVGETIYRIARNYGLGVYRLARANNLEKPYQITAGQTLCIPATPAPSSNFSWTVRYSSDQIKISGTDYKKQHLFFVKVRENDTSAWYKLNKVITDRQGELTTKLNVPKELLKKPKLTLCLKDGSTDYLSCKTVCKQ